MLLKGARATGAMENGRYILNASQEVSSKMKKSIMLLFAAAGALALSACGTHRHDPLEKYFLVTPAVKAAYWQEAWAGFNHAAFTEGEGVQSGLAGPDTYDPQSELQEFRVVVSLKPAGILVSAADPAAMKGAIDSAIAQGIPVITIDSDVPDSKRLSFIGSNNFEAGAMAGKVLADKLKGKGDVVVYTNVGQQNAEERLRGYQSVLSAHPQIKIVKTVDVKGDARAAFDATDQMVKSKSVADGFICLISTPCPEVADVLDRANLTSKVIIAMDTLPTTLDWLKKGRIAATISQKPYTRGQFGLIMLDALHHYKLPPLDGNWQQDQHSIFPKFVETGATLIDSSNVDTFRKGLADQGGS